MAGTIVHLSCCFQAEATLLVPVRGDDAWHCLVEGQCEHVTEDYVAQGGDGNPRPGNNIVALNATNAWELRYTKRRLPAPEGIRVGDTLDTTCCGDRATVVGTRNPYDWWCYSHSQCHHTTEFFRGARPSS